MGSDPLLHFDYRLGSGSKKGDVLVTDFLDGP